DWQPESWGGYIVENLFESIEVLLGYVTNTMSFLRVGAFVLVHAGMMMVVFVLAETAGASGSFFYWLIVVIGNVLVMALEALLVAIQVLRLEYYEMFSRFYSGEGRPFEPVKIITE
ncbi:MAG: ATPase, partial [Ruminococcus sp.]|nr:ATPase [Ruminococcus sp.]